MSPYPNLIPILGDAGICASGLGQRHRMTFTNAEPSGIGRGTAHPTPILRSLELQEGRSDPEIRALRRSGEWSALRPGVYLPTVQFRTIDPADRHAIVVRERARALGAGSVVSHTSAAILYGLPLWQITPGPVHVTRQRRSGTNKTGSLHVHPSGDGFQVVTLDGVAVTGVARTVVDVARTVPFEQAVVIADAALHRSLVTPEELVTEAYSAAGQRGAKRAAAVVAFADGRSESVGESRSRVVLQRLGMPKPDLQVDVADAGGRVIGRCDFGYPALRIAGEFDGRVKYGRLLRPGQQPGDVVFAEKLREDALRDAGWIVIRWIWDELDRPRVIAMRLRRAFERSASWV